jgi:hypothetical protein
MKELLIDPIEPIQTTAWLLTFGNGVMSVFVSGPDATITDIIKEAALRFPTTKFDVQAIKRGEFRLSGGFRHTFELDPKAVNREYGNIHDGTQ